MLRNIIKQEKKNQIISETRMKKLSNFNPASGLLGAAETPLIMVSKGNVTSKLAIPVKPVIC